MRWAAFSLLSLLLITPGLRAQEATADTSATKTEASTADQGTPAPEAGDTQTLEATSAPAPDADTAAEVTTSEEPAASADDSKPMDTERLIVTSVAGVVAIAGLAAGATFGVMALNEYNCLSDVVACNKDLDEPIEGTAYLDAKESVERNALYADMGYLVAATAATVAIVGAVELLFGSDSEVSE